LTLIVGRIRQNNLLNNFEVAEAYVRQVLPGGVTGGGIQFRFANRIYR
jgi:hypothetical protein